MPRQIADDAGTLDDEERRLRESIENDSTTTGSTEYDYSLTEDEARLKEKVTSNDIDTPVPDDGYVGDFDSADETGRGGYNPGANRENFSEPEDSDGGGGGGLYDTVAAFGDFMAGSTDEAVGRQFDDEPGGGVIDGTVSTAEGIYNAGDNTVGAAHGTGEALFNLGTGRESGPSVIAGAGRTLTNAFTGGNAEQFREDFWEQEGDRLEMQRQVQQEIEGDFISRLGAVNTISRVGLDIVADTPNAPNLQDAGGALFQTVTGSSSKEEAAQKIGRVEDAVNNFNQGLGSGYSDAISGTPLEDNWVAKNVPVAAGTALEWFVMDPFVEAPVTFTSGIDPETNSTGGRAEPLDVLEAATLGGAGAVSKGSKVARGAAALLPDFLRRSDEAASVAARTDELPQVAGSSDEAAQTANRVDDTAGNRDVPALEGEPASRRALPESSKYAESSPGDAARTFDDSPSALPRASDDADINQVAARGGPEASDAAKAGDESGLGLRPSGPDGTPLVPRARSAIDDFFSRADGASTPSGTAGTPDGNADSLSDVFRGFFAKGDEAADASRVDGAETPSGTAGTPDGNADSFADIFRGFFAKGDEVADARRGDEVGDATDATKADEASDAAKGDEVTDGAKADESDNYLDFIDETSDSSLWARFTSPFRKAWRGSTWRGKTLFAGALGALGVGQFTDIGDLTPGGPGPDDGGPGGDDANNNPSNSEWAADSAGEYADWGVKVEILKGNEEQGYQTMGYAVYLGPVPEEFSDILGVPAGTHAVVNTQARATAQTPVVGSGSDAVWSPRFDSSGAADDAHSAFISWLESQVEEAQSDGGGDADSPENATNFDGSLNAPDTVNQGEAFTAEWSATLAGTLDSFRGRLQLALEVPDGLVPLAEDSLELTSRTGTGPLDQSTSDSGAFEVQQGWTAVEPGDYTLHAIIQQDGDTLGALASESIEVSSEGEGDSESGWDDPEMVRELKYGWYLYVQVKKGDSDEKRFMVVGVREDGTQIFIQRDGRAAETPEFFPTAEEAASAYEEWVQRYKNGNTRSSEEPDPNADRPDPSAIKRAAAGVDQSPKGLLGRLERAARSNPVLFAGGAAATLAVGYWAYQNGYFDTSTVTEVFS